jgi:single-strand DNA-binding protein
VFQQCMIIGNLGRDPEMRYMPDGRAVTSFTVAVSRKWTGRDGTPGEKTWWFKVTCWDKLGETANQYLKKGRQVMIIGEVDIDVWADKSTNEPRGQLALTAREVKFLGSPRDDAGGAGSSNSSAPNYAAQEEEDIPF